jgi:hypothetical protein
MNVSLLLATLASAPTDVLVVSYQSLGVDPQVATRYGETLRHELRGAQWTVLDSVETQRVQRAASMCGEDPDCLATIGQRSETRWVVAFGLGKLGGGFLVTTLLVDVTTSHKLAVLTERSASLPDDWTAQCAKTVATLFRDVQRPANTVALDRAEPAALQQKALQQNTTAPRRLVGPTIAATSLASAGTISTIVFGLLAASHFPRLSTAPAQERPGLDQTQRLYNGGADISLAIAVASGAAALILFLLGAPSEPSKNEAPSIGSRTLERLMQSIRMHEVAS